jgi:hypothetical protein
MMENNGRQRPPVSYEVLTEFSEIASISHEWDVLLGLSRCNRAFNCSKWYLATPELLPKLRPLVLVARRAHALAGVMPLWLDVDGREASFPDDYTDHPDIIAQDEDLEIIVGLLGLAISGTGDYDKLSLKRVKHDSNCVRGAKTLQPCRDAKDLFVPGKSLEYAVLDLARGYDEYVKTLSRKFRLTLNRVLHKAQRDGWVVRELRPADLNPERLTETYLALHLSRFGQGSDFKSDFPTVEAWMHKLFPSLFAEQRMRVFAMLRKERMAAIDLAMVGKSSMYGWPGGFVPEIQGYHPGKLLIHQAIRQSCLEGLEEYELGWWGQEYKRHWRPVARTIGELEFAAGTGLAEESMNTGKTRIEKQSKFRKDKHG